MLSHIENREILVGCLGPCLTVATNCLPRSGGNISTCLLAPFLDPNTPFPNLYGGIAGVPGATLRQ